MDETERQIQELFEEHEAKMRERAAVKRRLGVLREQLASFGRGAPAHLITERDEAQAALPRLDGEIRELTRSLQRLHNHATAASLFDLPVEKVKPELAPAVLVAQNRALYQRLEALEERMVEDRTAAAEWREAKETGDREWRETEREERRIGQQVYRVALALLLVMNVVTLVLILTRT